MRRSSRPVTRVWGSPRRSPPENWWRIKFSGGLPRYRSSRTCRAGLAAARRAAGAGASVVMVDDNPAPGGQIWRALPIPAKWDRPPGLSVLAGARVIAVTTPNRLTLETFDGDLELDYRSLIL